MTIEMQKALYQELSGKRPVRPSVLPRIRRAVKGGLSLVTVLTLHWLGSGAIELVTALINKQDVLIY